MRLKQLLATLILASLCWQLSAGTRPEAIPSKLTEVKANNWYLEKFRSWTAYLADMPEDRHGWVECFKAAQYSGMPQAELEAIVAQINEQFPATAEAYWVRSRFEGWSASGIENLEKALANLKSTEWLPDRVMLAEVKGSGRAELSERLLESHLIYPSLLNYSYNVLMSVGENGYLFVEGENTTIPLWILQDAMKIRQDVKVLNLDLLEVAPYRTRVFAEMGLKSTSDDPLALPMANTEKDFYFALTLPRQNFESLEDQLYVVGLTSLLSDKEINNYELLKQNIEGKFLLDYLTVDFNGEPKTSTGRSFEPNYIVPFYVLKEYYDKSARSEMSAQWEAQIKTIAERSQLAARVNMLLSRNTGPRDFKIIDLKVKKLDKRLAKVKDNIYAGAYEVTNAEYELFLNYLKDNGYDQLYEEAKIDVSKYDVVNRIFSESYHFSTGRAGAEDFSNYPTMDISFKAASLYCEWLTTQYNAQEGRQFKKVKFHLPSEKEWTMAALGYVGFQSWNFEDNVVKARPNGTEKPRYFEDFRIGDYDSVDYPWYHSDWYKFRSTMINEKGCYLGNVKTPDEKTCPSGIVGDGFRLTSPVGTYFSNDMGLFDVIGNVAEMTDEPGKAMGGSWNHPPEQSTITSSHTYTGPDPAVGFRVFMEVMEE